MQEKIKILYVDDEFINLQLFKIIFSKKYEVLTELNPIKALEILDKELEISIVISDMRMPQISGIEFIKKAKEKYPDKKYFILTGYEITEEIRQALDNRLILEHFKKPFDINLILKSIEAV
jgi:response regulator RpfG family c-di-GMP phosphodiesterase